MQNDGRNPSRAAEKKHLLAALATRYRIFEAMHKCHRIHSVMLILFVTMLTNAFSWAFNGEVFAHELDHEHHVLSPDPTAHLEAHQHAATNDDGHLDAATHLCLHAAGTISALFLHSSPDRARLNRHGSFGDICLRNHSRFRPGSASASSP